MPQLRQSMIPTSGRRWLVSVLVSLASILQTIGFATPSIAATTPPAIVISPAYTYVNTATPLSYTGGNGNPTVTWGLSGSGTNKCSTKGSFSGSTLTVNAVGLCGVTAAQTAYGTYNPASGSLDITVYGAAQAALTINAATPVYGANTTLVPAGGSGNGPVTYVRNSGPCTVTSAGVLSPTGVGDCYVTATKAADTTYAFGPAVSSTSTAITIGKGTQAALAVTSLTGSFGSTVTLTTSGGSSGGAVTYTVTAGTATGCSATGNVLSYTSTGTCRVTATMAGGANYNDVTSPQATVTIGVGAQAALSVTSTTGTYLTPLTLTTSGGSTSGTVTYVVANGSGGTAATGCALNADGKLISTSSGTCTVTATMAGNSNYNAVSSPATTVTLAKAEQAALTVTPSSVTYPATATLVTTGGSGTGTQITYTYKSGPCAMGTGGSTSVMTPSGAGNCVITVTKAGDKDFNAKVVDVTIAINLGTQAALAVTAASGTYLNNLTLAYTGGTGTGAVTWSLAPGSPCTIDSTTGVLSNTGLGDCVVTVSKAADANYQAAQSAPRTITIGKATQAALTITPASIAGAVFKGTPLTLAATGGTGEGAISFNYVSGACLLSGPGNATLTPTGGGSCVITATKAGGDFYNPVTSASTTVTIGRADQSPLVITQPAAGVYGTPITLSTTGGDGTGSVSYTVLNGGLCSISSNRISAIAAGTCTIVATKSGNTDYNPQTSSPIDVFFDQAAQAPLTIETSLGVIGAPLSVVVSGGSGTGTVSLLLNTAVSGEDCLVKDLTLLKATAGSCFVTARRAGDTNYKVAYSNEQQIFFNANQAQSALVISPASGTYKQPTTLETTGGDGEGLVTFRVLSGPCSVSGSTLSNTSVGVCSVSATKAADAVFNAVTSNPVDVVIGQSTQDTLSITSLETVVYGQTLDLSAAGGNTLQPPTFSVTSGGANCSISGTVLTATHFGTCQIQARRGGDTNYLAVLSAEQTINVTQAQQQPLLISTTSSVNGSNLQLRTTGGSGDGAVSYALTPEVEECILTRGSDPSVYLLVRATLGTCTVTATKAADANYEAKNSAPTSVFFAAAQTVSLRITSLAGSYLAPLTLSAEGGSTSGAITYRVDSGKCTVVGEVLSNTGAGFCYVTATRAGDATQIPISSDSTPIEIAKIQQPPLYVSSTAGFYSEDLALTTSGGGGLGAVTFVRDSGACSVTDSTLTNSALGDCYVTAKKAEDANYFQAFSESTRIVIGPAHQATLKIESTASTFGQSLILATSGGSGGGDVTFVVDSGNCAVSGTTLTNTSAGDCFVTATKAADALYLEGKSASTKITIAKAAQNALSINPATGMYDNTLTLATTGGSGGGAVTFVVDSGNCAVSGTTLTNTAAGDCYVTATKASDTNYLSKSSISTLIVISKSPQAPLTVSSTSTSYAPSPGNTYTLSTAGGSGGGSVSYVAVNGTALGCSVTGNVLTYTQTGTCLVTASKAGDGNYDPTTSVQATVTIAKGPQPAVFVSPTVGTFPSLTLSATGGAAGAYTFTAGTPTLGSGCTLTAGVLTVNSATKTCNVVATRAGDINYLPQSSASTVVTFDKAAQAALVLSTTSTTYNPSTRTLALSTGTSGSGTGAVSYVISGTGCTGTGTTTLTYTTAGTCTVTATKASDADYLSATTGPVTVTIGKANQAALTVTPITGFYQTNLPLTVGGGSGTGLPLTYSVVNGTGNCTISADGVLSNSAVGTCLVTVTKPADTNYLQASVTQTITIGPAPQATLAISALTLTGVYGQTLTLSTGTSGSGTGAVSYAVSAGPCSIAPGSATLSNTGAGTCTVTATKAADTNYQAASSAPTTITINKAEQNSLSINPPNTVAYQGFIQLSASGGSGDGLVTWTTTPGNPGSCSISGSTLSGTGGGTCSVLLTKAASANYNAATATTTITVTPIAQAALSVTTTTGNVDAAVTIATSGGSGTGALSFTSTNGTGECVLSGTNNSTLTPKKIGTCFITATKAADNNYTAVTSSPVTVTIGVGAQAPLSISTTTGTYLSPLGLLTSGGSGTGEVTYVVDTKSNSAGCSVVGRILSNTAAGSCIVTATKAADSNYTVISSPATTITIGKAEQADITTTTSPAVVTFPSPATLSTTGGSGTVTTSTYAVKSGPCSFGSGGSAAIMTPSGAGNCVVTVTKAGDTNYNPKVVDVTITINKGTQAALSVTSLVGTYATNLTLTSSGGSGTGAVTYALVSGANCSLSASALILSNTGVGTCQVTATKAADNNYNAATSSQATVRIDPANQAALTVTSPGTTYDPANRTYTLTASGGSSGGSITYAAVNGTATGCVAIGNQLTFDTAGTCRVTATMAGGANYNNVSSAQTTVTIAKAAQAALSIDQSSGAYKTPLSLTTTGGTGDGAVSFTVVSGDCTLSDTNKLTPNAVGIDCVVTASKAADANYLAVTSGQKTISIGKANQAAISFSSTSGVYGQGLTLATLGGSSTSPVVFEVSLASNICYLDADGVTLRNSGVVGTCEVIARRAGDANYNDADSGWVTITIQKAPQAELVLVTNSVVYSSSLALALTETSGTGEGAVSYQVAGGPCSLDTEDPSLLLNTGAGTCSVTITKAANDYYATKVVTVPVTVTKKDQTAIGISSTSGTFGTPLSLTASGGQAGAFTYAVNPNVPGDASSINCTLSDGKLTALTAGFCMVTATRVGDANYKSVESASTRIDFARGAQAPVTATAPQATIDVAVLLTPAGGSGTGAYSLALAPASASNSNDSCALTGASLVGSVVGSCEVLVTREADNDYEPATPASVFVKFSQAQPALAIQTTSGFYKADLTLSTGPTGAGSGTVTFALEPGSSCTLVGDKLSNTGAGSCFVTATKAGDSNYNPAQSPRTEIKIGPIDQDSLAITSLRASLKQDLALTVAGGSTAGAVTYSVVDGPCQIAADGFTLKNTATGSCTVSATMAANANYKAVTVTGTVVVDAKQRALNISSISGTYLQPLTLATTGGSGDGAVSFVVVPPVLGTSLCSIALNVASGEYVLTSSGAGTCQIAATKAADAEYDQATAGPVTVTLAKATQATVTLNSTSGTYLQTMVLSASGGSSTGTYSYAVTSGSCTVFDDPTNGPSLANTAAGPCTVVATRAGDENFVAKDSAATTVTIAKALQASLSVTSLNAVFDVPMALTSEGGSGSGSLSYAVVSGPCSVDVATAAMATKYRAALAAGDPVLLSTGTGTCVITATRAESANYLAKVSGEASVSVAKANQPGLAVTSLSSTYAASLILAFSGGAGTGAPNWAVTSGSCAVVVDPVNGPTLTNTSIGDCAVTLSKDGDANYNAAPSVSAIIVIGQASQTGFSIQSTSGQYLVDLPLTTRGGAGVGTNTWSVTSGNCSITGAGATLSNTAVGSCGVSVTNSGNVNYKPVTATANVTIGKAAQAALGLAVTSTTFNAAAKTLTLTPTGGSGTGAYAVALVSGSTNVAGCSVTAGVLTYATGGTCNIRVTRGFDTNYLDATADITVTINPAAQSTLTLTSTGTTYNAAAKTYALTATGGSTAGTITYATTTPGCTISSATLTYTGAGICTVTATMAGNASYNTVSSAATDVTIAKASRTLAVSSLDAQFGVDRTLTASGDLGIGTNSWTLTAGGPCTLVGTTLSNSAMGNCVVTVSNTGDSNYNPASASGTVVVGQGPQVVAVSLATAATTYNASAKTMTLTGSGGSGTGTYTFALAAAGTSTCSVSGSTLTYSTGGTCSVTVTKAAQGSYLARSDSVTVTVNKAAQAPVSIISALTMTYGQTALSLQSSGGTVSGNPTWTTSTTSVCSITSPSASAKLNATTAGNCAITVTKAGDSNYLDATASATVVIAKANQNALSLTNASLTGTYAQTNTLNTTGGSGTGTTSYRVDSGNPLVPAGNCSVSGTTLSNSAAGICYVIATKEGDGNYNAVSSAATQVTINKANQIALVLDTTSTTYNPSDKTYPLTTSGAEIGTLSYGVTGTGCALSGATLTYTTAGTCTVTATRSGDSNYNSASTGAVPVIVGKALQQADLAVDAVAGPVTVGAPITLSAAGGTGDGAISFNYVSGPCTLSGTNNSTLNPTGIGSCVVTATRATDVNYQALTSGQASVLIGRGTQRSLSIDQSTALYRENLTLTVTGGSSDLPAVFTLDPFYSTDCTLVGPVLWKPTPGDCHVIATRPGGDNYSDVTSPSTRVAYAFAVQPTLAVSSAITTYLQPITLLTTGGAGDGELSFALVSGPCTLSGAGNSTLTPTGAGTCLVTATKGGDSTYAPATSTQASIRVDKAIQSSLSFASTDATFGTDLTLVASGGDGGGVITYSKVSGACTLSGTNNAVLTPTAATSCVVTATRAETANYLAGSQTETIRIAKAAQSAVDLIQASGTYGTDLTLAGKGGSGTGSYSFSGVLGDCVLAPDGVTLANTKAGDCFVTVTRLEDSNYLAKSNVVKVTFAKAQQPAVSLKVAATVYAQNLILEGQGGAGTGAFSFSDVSGVCTLVAGVLQPTAVGDCFVTVTRAGSDNYLSQVATLQRVTVGKATQNLLQLASVSTSYRPSPNNTMALTLAAGGSGEGTLTYAVDDAGNDAGCAITGWTLSYSTAGTCSVIATRATDANYLAASSTPTEVTIGQAAQAAVSLLTTNTTFSDSSKSATLEASGGSGTGGYSYTVSSTSNDAVCAVSGARLTYSNAGTCIVIATRDGDANYLPATPVERTFTVNKAAQAAVSLTSTRSTYLHDLPLVGAGGSGSGTFTYQLAPGSVCSLSVDGTTLKNTGVGTCSVTAVKAADTNYLQASSPATTVTIDKATQAAVTLTTTSTTYAPSPSNTYPLSISGSGSGGGPVSFTVSGTGCSISGSSLVYTQAGTCMVTANKAGDTNYLAATSGAVAVTVAKAPQAAVSMTAITTTYSAVSQTAGLSASGGSGTGSLVYSVSDVSNGAGCSVAGVTLTYSNAGTCLVSVTRDGDTNYLPSTPLERTFTVNKAAQAAVSLTSIRSTYLHDLPLAGAGGSGTGAYTFRLNSGTVCSLSVDGLTLKNTGIGTCSVTAIRAADVNYLEASSPATTVTIAQADQNAVTLATTSTTYAPSPGNTYALSIAGSGSGSGAVTFTASGTGCTVSGTTLTYTTAGTCTVTANKAADTNYLAATSGPVPVTIAKAAQTANVAVTSLTTTYTATRTYALTASGGSGTGTYSFATSTAGCSISASTLTYATAGSCVVTATRAGDTNYLSAASNATTVTINKAAQAAVTLAAATTTYNAADPTITLSASGGSGTGAFSFATGTVGCSIAGNVLTYTAAVTCSVTATRAADDNYLISGTASATATINKAPQAATVAVTSPGTTYAPAPNNTYQLTATGGSGDGAYTFTASGTGCTVTGGSLLNFTQAGTCSVTAIHATDDKYLQASSPATGVVVAKATQGTLSVGTTATTYNAAAKTLTLSSSGGSGAGAVSYQLVSAGTATCSISAATLTYVNAGTCTVTATKATDTNYNAATSAVATITVNQATQAAVTLSSTSGTYSSTKTFALTATGGSGTGSYVFTTTTTGCSISGSTLTYTSAGTCAVSVTRSGDANYVDSAQATGSVVIARATQTPALIVTSISTTFDPATKTYPLVTSGGAGDGAVTFAATGTGCSISGSSLVYTQAGTCTVTATKAQDTNYLALSSAAASVVVAKATQAALTLVSTSTTFVASPNNLYALVTSGGSASTSPTFTATGTGCTISGSNLVYTQAGTCTVTATKATDTQYLAVSSAPTPVTVSKGTQATLAVSSLATTWSATTKTYTLTTTGGSGAGAVSYQLVSAGTATCSISAATLTYVNAGTCTVTATKATDTNYNAATSAVATITVNQAAQAAVTLTSISTPYNATTKTYTLVGGGGTVGTFSYSLGAAGTAGCSVSGSTLTFTNAGTCTAVATRSGDTNYAPASSAPTTVTITKIAQAALTVSPTSTVFDPATRSLALTIGGGSGTGLVTVAATGTGCTISGSDPSFNLNYTQAGTCTVTATKALDTNYNVASSPATAVVVSPAAARTPTFDTPVQTANGFTVNITNYDAAWTWTTTTSAGTLTRGAIAGTTLPITIAGLAAGATATITATAARTGFTTGSATKAGTALLAALVPTFTTPVATTSGFTFNVTNYNAAYVFTPTITAGDGTATLGTASGTTLPVTVTGVTLSSATVTMTTTRAGYANGTATRAGTAIPAISSLTPTSGPIGTSVTITGTNFTGATSVRIGATSLTTAQFSVTSKSTIVFSVPTGLTLNTALAVTVVTAGGTSTGSNFTVTAATAVLPQITSMSATSGGRGTAVLLQGTNIGSATAARWGTTTVTLRRLSTDAVIVSLPNVTSGSQPFSLTTPSGNVTSSAFTVTSTAAVPVVADAPFTAAQGTYATLTGSNLAALTGMTFRGTAVTALYAIDVNTIAFLIPATAALGASTLTITTTGGSVTYTGLTVSTSTGATSVKA